MVTRGRLGRSGWQRRWLLAFAPVPLMFNSAFHMGSAQPSMSPLDRLERQLYPYVAAEQIAPALQQMLCAVRARSTHPTLCAESLSAIGRHLACRAVAGSCVAGPCTGPSAPLSRGAPPQACSPLRRPLHF
jgi:hypothetical protein